MDTQARRVFWRIGFCSFFTNTECQETPRNPLRTCRKPKAQCSYTLHLTLLQPRSSSFKSSNLHTSQAFGTQTVCESFVLNGPRCKEPPVYSPEPEAGNLREATLGNTAYQYEPWWLQWLQSFSFGEVRLRWSLSEGYLNAVWGGVQVSINSAVCRL